jgi:hypothetical protein
MTRLLVAAVVLAGPLLAGVAKTRSDFDPDANFTKYKRYSFVEGKELTKTGLLTNPETVDRLKNFIAGALEMRGLHEVPVDQRHDVAVRFWVAREMKEEKETVAVPDPFVSWGGYPPFWTGVWGWYYTEVVVGNYVEGTLIVDLIDTASKDLVWRTYLRVDMKDRAKAYKEAKKQVYKEFAGLPPSDSSRQDMRKRRDKAARELKAD